MAIYKQKGSGFWWYDFTVDGRRHRGSTKFNTKAQALALESELRVRAAEKGPNYIPRRRFMTLRELAPRFLAWKGEAQLEEKTRRYYEYGCKILMESALASMQLSYINSEAVESATFYRLKRDEGCDLTEAGPHYANQAIRTLKRILSKAKEWHLIAEVPPLKSRKASGRTRLISPEEEQKLIAAAGQPTA